MRKIALTLALALLLPIAAFAADKAATDAPAAKDTAAASDKAAAPEPDPYHNWLAYFYMEKDVSKMPDFLKWLQASGTLEKHPGAVPFMEGFLGTVFTANPTQIDGWSKAATFTGKTLEVVTYAAKPPVTPDAIDIKTPGDLDLMWGAYSATGNDAYLTKIEGVLDKNKPLSGDATKDNAVRVSAAWSLGANMTQHEAVERFLVTESARRTDQVGDVLKNIVAQVRKQREAHALPARDGEFSAAMVINDPEAVAKAFASPAGDVVHLKELERGPKPKKDHKIDPKNSYVIVTPGQKLTFVIVFAGMQLTPDFHADVTYDVKLTDPTGKVYFEKPDLDAVKQKVPTRFRIFNNKDAVFISFDKKDPLGIYKIDITLKDNIGKKTVMLSDQIKLTKKK